MKCLLAAINAKYIHSNPGIYSLKAYAEQERKKKSVCVERTQGGGCRKQQGLPAVHIEIGEYTINNQMEKILEDIYRRKPDIIGFSCYIWNVEAVLALVQDIHKVLPDTDIWLGGPEVSFDAPVLLEREQELLGIMKGEGEAVFSGLLRAYEAAQNTVWGAKGRLECMPESFWLDLEQLAGISYIDRDGQIRDHEVLPVMDMDQIPFLYENLEDFENRIIYYESSRGCPFSCSYCLSSIDKAVRFRSLELVLRELDFFLEHKVSQVKFVDRTFNCKKSHAMAIWRHILEHDNGVTNFHFEVAADLMDQEELDLIARMRPGLIQLEIGVQSTNPETIREIHRTMEVEQVRRVTEQIRRGRNVHQHLDLIAGLPMEGYESFRASFNEVYAMRPDQLQLGFLKVLKGSYMYRMAEAYGLRFRERPPYEVLSTRWLSYGELLRLKGIEEMVEVYYNSGQFVRTLALLERAFPDAFCMYERLAAFYEEQGLSGFSHSRLARYEILYRFIERFVGAEPEPFCDALLCDLYLREHAKSRPFFAPSPAEGRRRLLELEPGLRKLGTQIHAELLSTGELLLFDYRTKDALTHNARVISLGYGTKAEPGLTEQSREDKRKGDSPNA